MSKVKNIVTIKIEGPISGGVFIVESVIVKAIEAANCRESLDGFDAILITTNNSSKVSFIKQLGRGLRYYGTCTNRFIIHTLNKAYNHAKN